MLNRNTSVATQCTLLFCQVLVSEIIIVAGSMSCHGQVQSMSCHGQVQSCNFVIGVYYASLHMVLSWSLH